MSNRPMLKTRPDRIFVSVNQSTGRSTISFAPAEAGNPISHEGDGTGAAAMRDAKAISDSYPGASIHGPHFHTARPAGAKRSMRRAPTPKPTGDD